MKEFKNGNVTLLNCDCMEYMDGLEDNAFDLAVVDPPYGIGEDWKKSTKSKLYNHKSSYKNDCIPTHDYFVELLRVSKNQIVWGGNYYTEHLTPGNNWIVWDKKRDFEKTNMSEAELAWHSFSCPVRIVELAWNGFIRCGERSGFHPHEKPIALYKWIFANYAKPGHRILDTHGGSFSSAIAAHYAGLEFIGCELDTEYYEAAVERFKRETRQVDFLTELSK